ncbi:MAG: hypothetical protein IJX12_08400 [Lachnospiraceae bacterium]|nr:hypothetical protein [Lachnospiraceae bacterium]
MIKSKLKKITALLLCTFLVLGLTGCSDKQVKRYQNYVKSLIAINYLGATEDYVEATGANQADADALYEANMEHLADNIINYYDITISDVSGAKEGYIELAKNIYSKINYKVDKAVEKDGIYTVDVTIHPINLFVDTSDEVQAYVEKFNEGVFNGDYNNYTLEQYETEFSDGLLEILNEGCLNMAYAEPVVVTVTIIEEGNLYYISDEDFLAIDAAIIATSTPVDTTETSPNE